MTCPSCGGEARLIHAGVADFEYGVTARVDFGACTRCGLVFQSPAPTREQLKSWYPAEYSHHVPADSGNSSLTLLGRLKDIQTGMLVRKCEPYLGGQGAKILEVGCGTGRFLLALEKRGYRRLTGIDQAEAMAGHMEGTTVRFVAGSLEDSVDLDPPYDAILMHSVIEHFANPAHVLATCADLLSPGGRLILRTPNADSICHRAFGRYWAGLQAPRHVWIFSPANLERVAKEAGFERARWIRVEDASGWAFSLQNLITALRQAPPPGGGVTWYALMTLPLWYPLSFCETMLGRPSTLFCSFGKPVARTAPTPVHGTPNLT